MMVNDRPSPEGWSGRLCLVENWSFEAFYLKEYRQVLALARVLTGDLDRAEDLTQDAFATALEAWDRLENPAGWIRRVVVNKAKSGWRRRYAERRAVRKLMLEGDMQHELSAVAEDFWEQVRSLPRRQAQAVALFYLEDRPVSDIAEILGCAESTARVHLMRGRRSLARKLGVDE